MAFAGDSLLMMPYQPFIGAIDKGDLDFERLVVEY